MTASKKSKRVARQRAQIEQLEARLEEQERALAARPAARPATPPRFTILQNPNTNRRPDPPAVLVETVRTPESHGTPTRVPDLPTPI